MKTRVKGTLRYERGVTHSPIDGTPLRGVAWQLQVSPKNVQGFDLLLPSGPTIGMQLLMKLPSFKATAIKISDSSNKNNGFSTDYFFVEFRREDGSQFYLSEEERFTFRESNKDVRFLATLREGETYTLPEAYLKFIGVTAL